MCSQIFLHKMNSLGAHKNCVIELLMSPAIYDFGEKTEKKQTKKNSIIFGRTKVQASYLVLYIHEESKYDTLLQCAV